jgi:hypothetical protein
MVMVMCLTRLSAARAASSRSVYKIVFVLYNVLATIYLTKVNPPEQYLTQEAAPGYGCDEHVTRDIGCTNINHHPLTQPQYNSGGKRHVLSFNPLLLTSIYKIQTLFPRGNHPKAHKRAQGKSLPPHLELTKKQPQTHSPSEWTTCAPPGRSMDATTIENRAHCT